MNPGRSLALLLDDLFADPEFPDMAAELRRHAPTGFLDQMDAASSQITRGTAAAIRAGTLSDTVATPYREVPDWLRLGLLDTYTAWFSGSGSTCLHSPHPARPQPVVAAAWRPHVIVCAACTHLLALPRHSASDRRCDCCGHECTGVEHDDGIAPGQVALGPLAYWFGACNNCRWWTAPGGEAA